jgi:hypothetical protein
MRALFPAVVAAVLLAAGCGGDDDSGSSDPAQVEASVKAQLAKGQGGGVVDLGNDPPKLVTCTQDPSSTNGWRCTVRTAKGRSMLCLVKSQSGKKVPPTPVCGPIDN